MGCQEVSLSTMSECVIQLHHMPSRIALSCVLSEEQNDGRAQQRKVFEWRNKEQRLGVGLVRSLHMQNPKNLVYFSSSCNCRGHKAQCKTVLVLYKIM